MKKNSIIPILLSTVLLGSILTVVAPMAIGYNPGIATYSWAPGVPNYNSAATINSGTINTINLVMGDFLGISPIQPNAPGYGDSGVSVGWDDTWTGGVGDPNTNGDALDGLWVQVVHPAEGWWDLGFKTDKVVIFLSQDHGPYLGEGLETRVYGSDTLWGAVSAQAVLTDVYLDGWRTHNPIEDTNGNGWCSDDIAGVYELPGVYRYIKIAAWSSRPTTYNEPEVDAVAALAPTFEPIADSYTDERIPYRNYGSATTLWAYNKPYPIDRYMWLKFDLSDVTTVNSATLHLHPHTSAGYPRNCDRIFGVHFSSDDNWDENTIIWNNQPGFNAIAEDTVTNPVRCNPVEFDVTSIVQSEANGDGYLTIVIKSEENCFMDYLCVYSKEHSDQALRPYLDID